MEEKDPNTTERSMKPWIIYLVIFGAIFVLLTLNTDPKKGEETKMDYREFKRLLDTNLIVEAKIKYSQATDLRKISGIIAKTNSAHEAILEPGGEKAIHGDRFSFESYIPKDHEAAILTAPNITQERESTLLMSFLLTILPFLIIVLFIYFFFIRQIKMAGKGAMNFGKSKARMTNKDKNKITFKD
ncbi:MAG: hypothetical protein VCB81_02995, partial [Verrucomicrobiia bacterium]